MQSLYSIGSKKLFRQKTVLRNFGEPGEKQKKSLYNHNWAFMGHSYGKYAQSGSRRHAVYPTRFWFAAETLGLTAIHLWPVRLRRILMPIARQIHREYQLLLFSHYVGYWRLGWNALCGRINVFVWYTHAIHKHSALKLTQSDDTFFSIVCSKESPFMSSHGRHVTCIHRQPIDEADVELSLFLLDILLWMHTVIGSWKQVSVFNNGLGDLTSIKDEMQMP